MVNVTIYGIHGSYGISYAPWSSLHGVKGLWSFAITHGWSHLDTYGRSPDLGYNPKQSPKKEATIACVNLQKTLIQHIDINI